MSSTLRNVLAGIVIVLVVYVCGRCSGEEKERRQNAAVMADTIAKAARAAADSVERDRRERARDDSIAAAAELAAEARRRDSVIAASRIAQATAATQALNARQLAALQEATADQLRVELVKTADQVDTLNATIDRERAAATRALARKDTTYTKRIASLQAGFDSSWKARDRADSLAKKAVATAIERAQGDGLRKGRLQTLGGVLTLSAIACAAKC